MKIMVITGDHVTDHMGGTRVYRHELNRFLVKRGNTVEHVCYLSGKTENDIIDGVIVKKIPKPQKSTSFSYYLTRFVTVRRFIKDCYRSFCPDLVLIDGARTVQYLVGNVIPHREVVYFVHAMNSHEIMYNAIQNNQRAANWRIGFVEFALANIHALLMWIFEEASLLRCSKIITVSKYDLSEINRFHGTRFNKKVDIIPIGIDLDKYNAKYNRTALRERYEIPKDKCVFITVRRLTPRMGIESLLEAITHLDKDDYILLLCGKGELEFKIKEIIEKNNLRDNARYLGYVSEEKKIELLHASDIFVLPTKELEGFGIVTLEALATNTPVIGTPAGAIPEILNTIGNEFITEDITPDAIRKKLSWAIKNREKIVATNLYKSIVKKYYNWEKIVIDIEKSLNQVNHS